jgi:hypothetical protein
MILTAKEVAQMKYLCLCYYDIDKFASLAQSEKDEIGPSCRPYDALLSATGKVVSLGSLADPEEWRTISPHDRKPVVTVGPLTHIGEQVGAFFIIEAKDIDEAVSVASNHAAANYGEHIGFAVEVRPCQSFE